MCSGWPTWREVAIEHRCVDGRADKTVWVLKFDTPVGVPIAILFNYEVHSVAGGGDNKISGDLGGMAERYVERQFSDKFVGVFSMVQQRMSFLSSPLALATRQIPTRRP